MVQRSTTIKNLPISKPQVIHHGTSELNVILVANYKFRPENEDELPVDKGDMLKFIEKKDNGWILVKFLDKIKPPGLIPGGYVDIVINDHYNPISLQWLTEDSRQPMTPSIRDISGMAAVPPVTPSQGHSPRTNSPDIGSMTLDLKTPSRKGNPPQNQGLQQPALLQSPPIPNLPKMTLSPIEYLYSGKYLTSRDYLPQFLPRQREYLAVDSDVSPRTFVNPYNQQSQHQHQHQHHYPDIPVNTRSGRLLSHKSSYNLQYLQQHQHQHQPVLYSSSSRLKSTSSSRRPSRRQPPNYSDQNPLGSPIDTTTTIPPSVGSISHRASPTTPLTNSSVDNKRVMTPKSPRIVKPTDNVLKPISINISNCLIHNHRYWYRIDLKFDDRRLYIGKFYQDFYNLHVDLLNYKHLPRLPDPLSFNDNESDEELFKILVRRCNELNHYINTLYKMNLSELNNWLKNSQYVFENDLTQQQNHYLTSDDINEKILPHSINLIYKKITLKIILTNNDIISFNLNKAEINSMEKFKYLIKLKINFRNLLIKLPDRFEYVDKIDFKYIKNNEKLLIRVL